MIHIHVEKAKTQSAYLRCQKIEGVSQNDLSSKNPGFLVPNTVFDLPSTATQAATAVRGTFVRSNTPPMTLSRESHVAY
jgi:hypothetical protein